MRYLIAEDEPYTFESTCRIVRLADADAVVVTHVEDTMGLREALQHQEDYDVLLADIHLSDGLCFSAFVGLDLQVPVVFTTAYDQYALDAFRVGGVSYLLKPLNADEVRRALDRARRVNLTRGDLSSLLRAFGVSPDAAPDAASAHSQFCLETYDGERMVAMDEISHFSTKDRRTMVWLTDGRGFQTREPSLDAIETQLDPAHFFRANRQYIVSARSIASVRRDFGQRRVVLLKDYPEEQVSISKERVPSFRQWLEGTAKVL